MEAVTSKQSVSSADENYFDVRNLGQIADINGHLDFLEKIADKYILTNDEKEKFNSILLATKRKQNDKLLNMSVVGEFSCGKSTFINALMRNELLSSCSLQGTTVANTVIEYSDNYRIKLIFKDKTTRAEFFNTLEELRAKVDEYTTNPDFTKNLHSVEIGLPSHKIQDVFRIIDTPGTNSLELWHEEVTKNALRELSDISVILIDSTKILPKSLCDFINENLKNILPQCVFVLTKFDYIPEKEHDMVVAYTRMKIESDFGLKDSLILPFSSYALFEGDEESSMYKISVESEKKLLNFMAKKKAVAQLKKTIYFADTLYDTATEGMNAVSMKTQKQLNLLEKTKHTDLSEFIKAQKEKHTTIFNENVSLIESEVTKSVSKYAINARINVIAKVKEQNTIDNLKKYVNDSLTGDCMAEMRVISTHTSKQLGRVAKAAEAQVLSFQDDFKKKFEELSILDVDFSKYKRTRKVAISKSPETVQDTRQYVAKELTKENRAIFGTAAAGAIIGTSIVPVIGTAIGAVAGLFAGRFFSPSVEKVQDNTIEKLSPSLNAYVSETCNTLLDDFKKQSSLFSESIENEIDAYYNEYKETVDAKFQEATNKMNNIKNKLNTINADMQEVQNRKFALSSSEKQIDIISRKEIES